MEALTRTMRLLRKFPAFLLVGMLLLTPLRFAGQEQDEYEVKAAFIFNLSKFVEWPQPADSSTFGICILGDDPFEASIDNFTHGKSASGRSIQVRRLKEVVDGKLCQIVFVSSAERTKAVKLVDAVRGAAILTIGETEDFLRMGGIIALSMEGSRVTIVINAGAAQNANLKVSAKLLTLAKIYKND